jgi:hypothetical protein
LLLDQTGEVLAQQLAQHLVGHCCVGLAHHAVAELPLDRADSGLGVWPLVVSLKVLFPVKLKEVDTVAKLVQAIFRTINVN